jgi:hypothetical protein
MSSLDWLQIVTGFRYCLRRVIILAVCVLAYARPERLVTVEPTDSTE